MAILLEERYLVDADDNVIGVNHSQTCIARVAELAYGVVVHSGLAGLGIRNAIEVSDRVADVRTPNEHAAVLARRRTRPGPPDDIQRALVMGLFDLSIEDRLSEADFVEELKETWPEAGGRVVILSEKPDIKLDGFTTLGPDLIEGTYVYIFDRFDPPNGIGVFQPHGKILVPGYGWE